MLHEFTSPARARGATQSGRVNGCRKWSCRRLRPQPLAQASSWCGLFQRETPRWSAPISGANSGINCFDWVLTCFDASTMLSICNSNCRSRALNCALKAQTKSHSRQTEWFHSHKPFPAKKGELGPNPELLAHLGRSSSEDSHSHLL